VRVLLLPLLVLTGATIHAQAATGTIRGRVTLGAAAPNNPVIRMGMDPVCTQLWGSERATQLFVVRGPNGELANAFVQLRGDFPAAPVSPTPVVIDQRRCVYEPHVVAVRAGQPLEIRNSDPTTHNVHAQSSAGNDFNMSRGAASAPMRVVFDHPEQMMRVTCDIHSWMNLFVAVVSHPYFAVTDAKGSFLIGDAPSGHQTLEVWHERYGPKAIEVDVPAGGTIDVTIAYSGTERPAPLSALQSR
jgi:plastocyanin